MNDWLLYIVPVAGALALLFAYTKAQWISKQEVGTERMAEIGLDANDLHGKSRKGER